MSSEDPENHKGTSRQDGKKELATGEHRDASTSVHESSGVEKGPGQFAHSQTSSGDTKDTIGSLDIEV